MITKKKIALTAAAAAALSLVGTVTAVQAAELSTPAAPEGFQTAASARAEFRSLEGEGVLPDGVAWPAIAPAELSEEGAVFQEGYLDVSLGLYSICAWEDALVSATDADDAAGAKEALAALSATTSTAWFTTYTADTMSSWEKDVVDTAASGDLSRVRADLESCGYFYENQQ